MMIDENILDGLRARYSSIHPLIFHRSVEKASSPGDLFDILDLFPEKYPVIWSEEDHRWVTTNDLVQINKFDMEQR